MNAMLHYRRAPAARLPGPPPSPPNPPPPWKAACDIIVFCIRVTFASAGFCIAATLVWIELIELPTGVRLDRLRAIDLPPVASRIPLNNEAKKLCRPLEILFGDAVDDVCACRRKTCGRVAVTLPTICCSSLLL